MKCADIPSALNDDTGDLEAVRGHLERCRDCSRRFARDLDFEYALRNLNQEVAPVDIIAGVRDSLGLVNRRHSRPNLVRKWVWGIVSAATLALLIIAMPILAGWSSKAYDLANRCDDARSIDPALLSAVSSIESIHLLYLMAAVLAWMAVYLWRETKRTVP
jgi:hypothetical protein